MLALTSLAIYIINVKFSVISVFLYIFLMYTTYSAFSNNQAYELLWQEHNSWLITQHNLRSMAELCDSSVITSVCAVLNFKLENGKRQSILLFKDSVDAESFRRLRVRIKVQGINPQSHDTINS